MSFKKISQLTSLPQGTDLFIILNFWYHIFSNFMEIQCCPHTMTSVFLTSSVFCSSVIIHVPSRGQCTITLRFPQTDSSLKKS
uniref:Uncharacterized protein n=1 Tax=Anguilla anguilla TaxID=7936 RepID=A0A0E9S5Y6_ANGAN